MLINKHNLKKTSNAVLILMFSMRYFMMNQPIDTAKFAARCLFFPYLSRDQLKCGLWGRTRQITDHAAEFEALYDQDGYCSTADLNFLTVLQEV